MLVNGKEIRDELKESLKQGFFQRDKKPRLVIVSVGENEVKEKFTELKKKFGEDIGVDVHIQKFNADVFENVLESEVKKISDDADAVLIQLPLPEHINPEVILNAVPVEKDIDMLSNESFQMFLRKETDRMPPVVGAVHEVLEKYQINLEASRVLVVGKGKLVGKPIFLWMMSNGITPGILDKKDVLEEHTKDADIIISGAGAPHIIKPEMIKEGVVLIDVGTSNDHGTLKGDIDPECSNKASIFSSSPGGIGPITIAKLFENITLK